MAAERAGAPETRIHLIHEIITKIEAARDCLSKTPMSPELRAAFDDARDAAETLGVMEIGVSPVGVLLPSGETRWMHDPTLHATDRAKHEAIRDALAARAGVTR